MAQDLALEDPDLDAANAISGVRLRLRHNRLPRSVQRNATFAIPFGAGDFRAAETAAAGDLDAFGAETQASAPRASSRDGSDTAFQLVGDALRDELRVDFRLADFDDVEADVGRRSACELACAAFRCRALLADDDARTRGIDRHAAQLGRTLDHDLEIAACGRFLHHILADLEIFQQQTAIVAAFGEPAAVPGAG